MCTLCKAFSFVYIFTHLSICNVEAQISHSHCRRINSNNAINMIVVPFSYTSSRFFLCIHRRQDLQQVNDAARSAMIRLRILNYRHVIWNLKIHGLAVLTFDNLFNCESE